VLQGHRSFLPNFSVSSLSPWAICLPRFTFLSDGNPLRRLLIVSKKTAWQDTGRGEGVRGSDVPR
jgi:hypothetical protein